MGGRAASVPLRPYSGPGAALMDRFTLTLAIGMALMLSGTLATIAAIMVTAYREAS